jgi:hypothetical protein
MAPQGIFQVFAVAYDGIAFTEAGESEASAVAPVVHLHMAPDSKNVHLNIADQRFSVHCPSPFPVTEARMHRQKKWRVRLRNQAVAPRCEKTYVPTSFTYPPPPLDHETDGSMRRASFGKVYSRPVPRQEPLKIICCYQRLHALPAGRAAIGIFMYVLLE